MITVQEVKTKQQQKEFLDFPLRLYKDNPCFVPPLYSDEKKMFRADYVYYDTCEAACWNAYKDGVMAGRIQAILQKAHNEKTGEKRIRFTRFDAIDDQAVADALFAALEGWAKAKGRDSSMPGPPPMTVMALPHSRSSSQYRKLVIASMCLSPSCRWCG